MTVRTGRSRDRAGDRAGASPPAAPAPLLLPQPSPAFPQPPPRLPRGFTPAFLGLEAPTRSPATSDRSWLAPPPAASAPRGPSSTCSGGARGARLLGAQAPTLPASRSGLRAARSKPISSSSPPASPSPRSPPACSGDVGGLHPHGSQAPALPARRSTSSPASSLRGRLPLRSIVVVPPSSQDAEDWLTVPPRRRPACQPDGGGDRPRPRDSMVSAAALRFRRRTEGLCARCLDPIDHDHHHRSSTCCKRIRCRSCKLSGHKERDCPLRRASKSARPASHPPRQPASSPLTPGALSWADVTAAPRATSGPAPSRSTAPPPPPPLEHIAAIHPPQPGVRSCACLHADEVRAILSDMAASLRAELKVLVADAVAPILAASMAVHDWVERASGITQSHSPSPSGDKIVPVDEGACRLAEMTLYGESDPSQDFKSPCASPSCGFVLEGLVATPSPFGHLQQHISSGVALTLPTNTDDIVALESAFVKEGLELSQDAKSKEDAEAAMLGDLSAPSLVFGGGGGCSIADARGIGASASEDVVTPLLTSVQDLFTRPDVPLLPCPAPRTPALSRVKVSTPEIRHSARLGDKPKMHTMDKVTKVLNKKMGIQVADDAPLEQARKQFVDSFKTQMSDSSLQGLARLFKLNIPSLAAVDDALLGLAGPGGVEFAPSAE